jgi:hypothetical protein
VELAFEAGSWWSYLLVFLAAATPVVEVLVVIPAGVLAGMPPAPTAIVAVAGNLSTVVLIAVAGDRIVGHLAGPAVDGGRPGGLGRGRRRGHHRGARRVRLTSRTRDGLVIGQSR